MHVRRTSRASTTSRTKLNNLSWKLPLFLTTYNFFFQLSTEATPPPPHDAPKDKTILWVQQNGRGPHAPHTQVWRVGILFSIFY